MGLTKEQIVRRVGTAAAGHVSIPALQKAVRFAAAKAYADGDLDEALRLYRSLPVASQDYAVRLRLANIAERQGRLEEALAAYQKLSEERPDDGEAAYRTGKVAGMLNHDGAEAYLARAIASGKEDRRYSENLLARLPEEAPFWRRLEVLEVGRSAHASDPSWYRQILAMQRRLNRESEMKETLAVLEEISTLTPEENYLFGCILDDQGEHAAAAERFASAVDGGGKKAKALGPAFFALREHDWRRADLLLTRFRPASMSDADLSYHRGLCRDQCRDWEAAEGFYANAVSRDYSNGYRSYKLGLSAERAGDLQVAEPAYDNALMTRPHPQGSWWAYRRAAVLAQQGRYDAAVAGLFDYFGRPEGIQEAAPDFANIVLQKRRTPDLLSPAELVDRVIDRFVIDPDERDASVIEWILPIVLKGDRERRKILADRAMKIGQHQLAAEILLQAEEFSSKDGLNPDVYLKTPASTRDVHYAEALVELPVASHVVLWESNHGSSIGCHPLALFRWIVDRPEYEDFIHVWGINDENGIPADLRGRKNVVFVPLHSREYMQVLATAGYLVNNVSFAPYFVRRPEQKYLNTWHGTPFKTLGRSMRGELLEYENLQRNFQLTTLLMAPNALTEWALIEDHDLLDCYRGVSVIAGSPRLDISIGMTEADKRSLRRRLGMMEGDDRKLLLYAPTWRGGVNERELDKETLIADLTAMAAHDDIHVVYRAHRLSEKLLDGVTLPVTVVPRDIDTNELLAAVDILVTDYSSIFFDYMPQRKPIVLYMHDLEEYRATRGLYLDPEDMPGIKCYLQENLPEAIRSAADGAGVPNQEIIDRFCPHEDGYASERLARLFFGAQDLDPAEGTVRDYSKDHGAVGKRSIVFHASMIPNGIASAFLALMEHLDSSDYSVSLIVEPKVLRSNGDRAQVFARLPEHVHVICRPGVMTRTIDERWCLAEYPKNPSQFTASDFWRLYWRAYERETWRIMGAFVPDAFVEYDGYAEVWASIAAAFGRRGARSVCYQHNQMDLEMREKYPNLMRLFLLYREFDQILAVSPSLAEHNKRELLNLGIDVGEKQSAARNLLDTARVSEGAACPLPDHLKAFMAGHATTIVTVGRMSREKNQLALIEALSRVVHEGMDVGLVLVGSGLLEPTIKARTEALGLTNRVYFTGQIDNPYPIIAAADGFVLPSTHEGQPVTLLEAMALGTPIIASDIPGNREIVTLGYGHLCGTDAEEISEALSLVLARPSIASGSFDIDDYTEDSYRTTLERIFD